MLKKVEKSRYQKSITLDEETVEIVDKYARDNRLTGRNFSLSLRKIVWEWKELQGGLEHDK